MRKNQEEIDNTISKLIAVLNQLKERQEQNKLLMDNIIKSSSIDNDKNNTLNTSDELDFEPVLIPDDESKKEPTYNVTFKNGDFNIEGYTNLEVAENQIIHGPVIDPVPLNKKGQKKRFTAQVFSGWKDQNGEDVDLSKPLNRDVILTAQYMFDMKKAVAVGLGAAVGTAAYVADLVVPTPVPVISMAGSVGLGVASRTQNRQLSNLQHQNEVYASQITAFEEIPEELQEDIDEAKRKGYIHTFLNSAAISCAIASAAHGLKNHLDASKAHSIANDSPSKLTVESSTHVNQTGSPANLPQAPANSSVSIQAPGGTVASPSSTTQVLNGYTPDGQVFRTAKDALEGAHGLHPYLPAYEGQETFEAYFNGVRAIIKPGQSLESILQSVGATDPSQVAVNVMNVDGVPLTWQKLPDLLTNSVEQVATMVR